MGTLVALFAPEISAAATLLDFGDAPDHKRTFYTGGTAIGVFPSLLAADGARTLATDRVWLGDRVNREQNSKQVNADEHDDGVTLALSSCTKSTARFRVHVANPGVTKGTAYLNLFVDWNKDGVWSGRDRCAAEWAIQNHPINLGKQAKAIEVYAPTFTAGVPTRGLWYRAVVTVDQPMTSERGKGVFRSGEVEDYGPQLYTTERYAAECTPALLTVDHSGKGEFTIKEKPGSPAAFTVSFANSVTPATKSRKLSVLGKKVVYESKKKDPPARFDPAQEIVDVRVRFGKKASILIQCIARVRHTAVKPNTPVTTTTTTGTTLSGVRGSFTKSQSGKKASISGELEITDKNLQQRVNGFEIPLKNQNPPLPDPIDIVAPEGMTCQRVGDVKRCTGRSGLWFITFIITFLENIANLPGAGLLVNLLNNGVSLGTVNLPAQK